METTQLPINPALIVLGVLLIIAVAVVLRQRGSGVTTVASAPPAARSAPLPADTDQAIRVLIQQQKKIEAIKLVRERTGLGLKEAKDYVEEVERGGAPALPPLHPAPAPIQPGALDSEVRALLGRDRKIEAIKLVREQTGMGLKEAKDYVDTLDR